MIPHTCCPHIYVRVQDSKGGRIMPSPEQCDCWCHESRPALTQIIEIMRTNYQQSLKDAQEAWFGLAGKMEGHEVPCATFRNNATPETKCDCGFTLYRILFGENLV